MSSVLSLSESSKDLRSKTSKTRCDLIPSSSSQFYVGFVGPG